MHIHKRIKRAALCLILICLMGFGGAVSYAAGDASQTVSVAVVTNPNIDLVLTTGITDVDLSNFKADVLAALEDRGIGTQNTDMVQISAIETTSASLESTSVDFASVVNNWQTVGADTWSANAQGQIYSSVPGGSSKPSWWGTALINPDGFEINDLQASFTLVQGGNLNEGFCFNVTQNEDGSLNGYFISYSNHVNTTRALFRFDHYTLDQAFNSGINNVMWCYNSNAATWTAGGTGTSGSDSYTCLANWTDSGANIAYEVSCKNGNIVIKDNGTVVANVKDDKYPNGTYGFWGNNCEMKAFSYVSNLKVTATKVVSKDYAQVLLEPTWREGAAHFVVNVEDPVNNSLNNAEALARTLADGIHFIQWGTDENKASAESFISKNDGNGIFTDNGNYQASVDATADYIKMIVDRMQRSNAQYVIVGENTELVVSPEELKTGAVSQLFPTGRWLVHHDENYFANSEGKSSATEVFQPDLMCTFDKPGKYEISFDNQMVKEVYAHRRPVADFNISIQGGTLTLTSASYDLDSEEDIGYGEGIAAEAWYYKEADADTWTSGKLDQFTANKVYMIRLEVTDQQGVVSSVIKYVGIGAPVAGFTLSSNAISTADRLSVTDTSYDPQGYDLTAYEWTLKKGGTELQTYTGSQFPDLDYNDPSFGEGDYSLSLKVTNDNGIASGVFTQFFTVETARYSNKYVHYAGGFLQNEENTDADGRFLLQTTYNSQTYGTEFLPDTGYALPLPNGFYLEQKFGTGQMTQEDGDYQEYDFGTKVTQPGYAMDFEYHYCPYEYTIEYDLDGGVLEGENPSSYTVLYGVTFQEPTKPHCNFLGWYDEDGNKLTGVNAGAKASFTNTADFYSKLATRKTGNLKLTAKWELRQYDITGIKYGHGTIAGGGRVTEGDDSTVTWTPDEGYKVVGVMVDGDVRDDLLNGGAGNTVSFADIQEDHVVKVDFAEQKTDDDGDEEEEPQYYTVTTEQKGGSQDAAISGSKTLAAGSDYTVEWTPGAMDVIQSITVDGSDYPTDKRSVEFRQLSGNHKVVVVYEEKKTEDGPATDGYYTITVNSWNGDASRTDTSVTGNAVVQPGSDHTVTWTAGGAYEVSGVVIDKGKATEATLTETQIAAGGYTFADVAANHTVDVIFENTAQDPDEPQPEKVQVTTELVGGPGWITESATVNEGDSYTVEWDPTVKTTEDVSDPSYAVYKVVEVSVNDQPIGADETSVELKGITEDQTVKVVMEPVLHQVETAITGMGSIDPTKTLYDGQNYVVQASPAAGWALKSVTVDGILEYEQPDANAISENSLAAFNDMGNADEVITTVNAQDAVPVNVSVQGITTNHKVMVVFAREDGTQTDPATLLEVTGRVEGGPGTFAGNGQYEAGSQVDLSWTVPEGYEVASVAVKVNGVQRNDIVPEGTGLSLTDIQDSYDVTVIMKKSGGGSGTSEPVQPTWSVTTAIVGGEGEITPTTHGLANGSNWKVEWDFDTDKYVIREVRIDGAVDDEYLNQMEVDFETLSADHSVEIVLISKDDPDAPDGNIKDKYTISTERTQGGTIDQSAAVEKGADHTVHWTPDEGYYVASVTVDGMKRNDLLDKDSIEFRNVGQDHYVEVVFAKDGEQKPDVQDMYTVRTDIGSGQGFIDSTVKVAEGAEYTVKWMPEAGWKVQTVIVDGQVRDDLRDADRIDFTNIMENHTVTVLFRQEGTNDGNPEGPFQIQTSREGKGTITDTAVVNKGDEYIVSWMPAQGYQVSRVEIDGVVCPELLETGQVTFKDVASDHRVNVVFDREDGTTVPADRIVHIMTGVTGGLGQITGSFTAEKGEDVTVEWKAEKGYVVTMVYVNGEERPDLVSGSQGSFTYKDVQEDMKVEVLFEKESISTSGGATTDPSGSKNRNRSKDRVGTGDGTQAGKYLACALLALAAVWICMIKMQRDSRQKSSRGRK